MKNFKLETTNGKYNAHHGEKSINGIPLIHWWIDVVFRDGTIASFQCLDNWAETRVFQFISDIDKAFN